MATVSFDDAPDEVAELERRGYSVTDDTPPGVSPGKRVRHVGERYPEALANGTATVRAVLEHPRTHAGRRNVEVVVERDRPLAAGMSRATTWADYHTVPVGAAGGLPS